VRAPAAILRAHARAPPQSLHRSKPVSRVPFAPLRPTSAEVLFEINENSIVAMLRYRDSANCTGATIYRTDRCGA
jgi:hypothetical protein